MILSINISQDHKTAIITYTDGTKRSLYQSDGRIEAFVYRFLSPMGAVEPNMTVLTGNIDDTVSIAA